MSYVEEGNKAPFWKDTLPSTLSTVRNFDRCMFGFWILCIVACVVYLGMFGQANIYTALSYMSLPFVAVGGIYLLYQRHVYIILATSIACVALYYSGVVMEFILIILYIGIGAWGVACIVDALQRMIFFNVVKRVIYLNISGNLKIPDKIVSFLFNIPPDLDTREIKISSDTREGKFPFKDMGGSIFISMVVTMFFWIYLSMNPNFMGNQDYTVSTVSMFMFTIMLYIPVIVMPFSIFKSVNARIVTHHRDFELYSGVLATIQRMAIPVFGALMCVFLAMNKQDPAIVLAYIAISAIMAMLIVCITSVIYYRFMEVAAVSDINTKWPSFIPASLTKELVEDKVVVEKDDSITPSREHEDLAMGLGRVRIK